MIEARKFVDYLVNRLNEDEIENIKKEVKKDFKIYCTKYMIDFNHKFVIEKKFKDRIRYRCSRCGIKGLFCFRFDNEDEATKDNPILGEIGECFINDEI